MFDIDEFIQELKQIQEMLPNPKKGVISLKTNRPKVIKCPVSFKTDEKNEYAVNEL